MQLIDQLQNFTFLNAGMLWKARGSVLAEPGAGLASLEGKDPQDH